MTMQKLLDELVNRLQKGFGSTLASVVLYGSAASGDHHQKFSDLNILCVLSQITTKELEIADPIMRWWREKDNPSPLLLTQEEIRSSTDCFPIEFHDIKDQGRVLHGYHPLDGIEIDDHDYRAEVEHELRSKILRLRQKAAGVIHDRSLLLRLMTDSVSTFCVLLRHTLALTGEPRKAAKREVLEQARIKFGIDISPFSTLLDLREEKIKAGAVSSAVELLERYLKEVQVIASIVDGIEFTGETNS